MGVGIVCTTLQSVRAIIGSYEAPYKEICSKDS